MANKQSITLGEVLKMKEFSLLHPALKKGLSNIYGYTSDENGIRHALIEDDQNVTFDEARLMLILCSAFVNYLITKAEAK